MNRVRFPKSRHLTLTACAAVLLAGCNGDDDPAMADATSTSAAQACAALAGQAVAGATVTAAAVVAASASAPTYCKVNATIAPQLEFEMRLPEPWNGKLYYEGGGGYDGFVTALGGGNLAALQQGYATVDSNGGHDGDSLSAGFALNDSTAANQFGSLSVPTVMSSATEMLVTAYGRSPKRAYFEGCSNGGREALVAAERNPNLFDGIIARAPGYNWVGFMGHWNRNERAVAAPGGQLDAAKLGLLAHAVRNACDAQDGIADGIVSNPQACTFDPAPLRCPGGADAGDSCLSDAQLAVVRSRTTSASYAGGAYTTAGMALTGNEDDAVAGWGPWVTGNGDVHAALHFRFQDTTVKYLLARDATRDSLAYDWDADVNALYGLHALIDATDTDLRPLKNSSAKLILWHGGADPSLNPLDTAAFYQGVVNAVGGPAAAEDFVRYYVAPGVGHCTGGPGADQSDLLTALDAWVDQGTAPGTLTANKVVDGATVGSRPLCRFPQYPRYTGPSNDTAAAAVAANYTCSAP